MSVRSICSSLVLLCLIGACASEPARRAVSQPSAAPPSGERFVRTSARRGETNSASRPINSEAQRCLALNLYWEARGEGRNGMYAVGWTVLNRVASPDFPASVCGVIYQGGETPPCQFSWWCDGRSDRPREWRSWETALDVSAMLLRNPPPDPTAGALFYHNTSIRSPWLTKRQRTTQIGQHVFYR